MTVDPSLAAVCTDVGRDPTDEGTGDETPATAIDFHVVGIGASAGGLDALRRLLPKLPTGDDVSYVIVQHQDPRHRSMMAHLLGSECSMEVSDLEDGAVLTPGRVLIAPAGYDLILERLTVHLRTAPTGPGPRPSIDLFFASLAENLGERAVGIILSGNGSDGAHGMRAIKGGGGFTLVQDPEDAKSDEMPRAAIETGSVDLTLAPEDMGAELVRLLRSPALTRSGDATLSEKGALSRLIVLVRRHTGTDFSGYKHKTIERRIARRLALHQLASINEYLAFSAANPSEFQALARDILISVTSFFRDEEAFARLAEIAASLFAAKSPDESIRVWVPGCATGEEAYSLALLLADTLGDAFESANVTIFATDVDAEAIAHARRGVYPAASLQRVSPELRDRFFQPADGSYQVSKGLRERVVFAKQDVIHNPPFSRIDLISCRNLLIYLNGGVQERLIPVFHYALSPGGYLFLGKSESIGAYSHLFETIDKRWRIFKRIEGSSPARSHPHRSEATVAHRSRIPSEKPPVSMRQVALQAIASYHDLSAVVINERLEVVHVLGGAGRYLTLSEGDAGLSITDLCPSAIRVSLMATVQRAVHDGISVSAHRLTWISPDGQTVPLDVHVTPIAQPDAPDGLLLVLFEPQEPVAEPSRGDLGLDELREHRIVALEQDLSVVRLHLETTTDELTKVNEELQSLNEELQSSNEELQSSNEELENAIEELQATNEELSTVNDELSVKSAELTEANTDLENILTRMDIPLVVVDRDHRVRRFTPPAASLFYLEKGDRGQSITSVGGNVQVPTLAELLDRVIETASPETRLVVGGSRHFELRAFPYVGESGKVEGAIMTFYDQTELRRRQEEFRALAENSPDIVERFDRERRYVYVNRAGAEAGGRSSQDFLGRSRRELGMPEDVCDRWDAALEHVFSTGREGCIRFDLATPKGDQTIETRLVPEFSPAHAVKSVIAVGRNVTPMVEAELRAQRNSRRLGHLLEGILDGFISVDEDLKVTYCNAAAARVLDGSVERVVGLPLADAFPLLTSDEFRDGFEAMRVVGGVQQFETCLDRGETRDWFQVRMSPRDDGFVMFLRVITDEKRQEKEQRQLQVQLRHAQKMEAVGTLAGGVAHEFNNLLAAIMGYAELAIEDTESERREGLQSDLEHIIEATQHGAKLVRSVLAFSRRDTVEVTMFDLGAMLGELMPVLSKTTPRMISLRHQPPPEPVVVAADRGQMQQVVFNLTSNAVDAMPSGGTLVIRLDTARPSAAAHDRFSDLGHDLHARLVIEDSGHGVPEELIERVFEPFFTTKAPDRGTGLGLSSAFGIIARHGGAITCEKSPLGGARFTTYLPLSDRSSTPSSLPPVAEEPLGGNETVLIVDDEDRLRATFARVLSEVGYRPLQAANGEDALAILEREGSAVDGIILDLNMPGMGGKACLARIRELPSPPPVLIVTGEVDQASLRELLSMGASAVAHKPLRIQALRRLLRQALDRAEA